MGKKIISFLRLYNFLIWINAKLLPLYVIGECGTMLTDHSGWFVAPDKDNDGLYDANVDCKWIIYVPGVDILRITIQDMDIQHYEECDLDYLEVSVLCPQL